MVLQVYTHIYPAQELKLKFISQKLSVRQHGFHIRTMFAKKDEYLIINLLSTPVSGSRRFDFLLTFMWKRISCWPIRCTRYLRTRRKEVHKANTASTRYIRQTLLPLLVGTLHVANHTYFSTIHVIALYCMVQIRNEEYQVALRVNCNWIVKRIKTTSRSD
jgi:hypothetical protein